MKHFRNIVATYVKHTQHLHKKKITTDVWKQMKHFEQTLATCFSNTCNICNVYNILDLVLQHQDENNYNKHLKHREREGRVSRFQASRWELAASRGARALPTPATLVGALDSAGEDLRRHDTCAPADMAGVSGAPNGDGRRTSARERATQVTTTQVSVYRERGRTARPAMGEWHNAAARQARAGEGSGRMSNHATLMLADKHEEIECGFERRKNGGLFSFV
jgi:hypothetical protein